MSEDSLNVYAQMWSSWHVINTLYCLRVNGLGLINLEIHLIAIILIDIITWQHDNILMLVENHVKMTTVWFMWVCRVLCVGQNISASPRSFIQTFFGTHFALKKYGVSCSLKIVECHIVILIKFLLNVQPSRRLWFNFKTETFPDFLDFL